MTSEQELSPNRKILRQFSFILGAGFILFFGVLLPWIWDKPYPAWPWVTALILGGLGLAVPAALGPLYRLWMKLGHAVGWVNTRIILGLVFFVVFFPFGLLMKLFRKDPMARTFDPKVESYKVPSEDLPRDRLEKPF